HVPDELESIVFKALASDVEDRYQSAIDLRDALRSWMGGANQSCSRGALSAWMKRRFAAEVQAELARDDEYDRMRLGAVATTNDDLDWDDIEVKTNPFARLSSLARAKGESGSIIDADEAAPVPSPHTVEPRPRVSRLPKYAGVALACVAVIFLVNCPASSHIGG